MSLPGLAEIEAAAALVGRHLPPTPQWAWPLLDAAAGCELWLKHENHTPTGAFKMRGGLVYLDALRRERPEVKGVVSATRGNHGQSLAFAARRFGLAAVVVVPRGNSREKNAAMRAWGAEVIEHGDDFHAADHHADELARARGLARVPSFDRRLVSGVATYGLELFRAAPPLEAVFVPVGWGSGACGVAAARNALGLATPIVGVVPAAAPSLARSFAAGRAVEVAASTRIADGMAISRPHPEGFAILRRELERVVEVSDADIEGAMRLLFSATHTVAEGAGAAAVAAVLRERERWRGRRVAAVVSGGNVDRDIFARVLAEA